VPQNNGGITRGTFVRICIAHVDKNLAEPGIGGSGQGTGHVTRDVIGDDHLGGSGIVADPLNVGGEDYVSDTCTGEAPWDTDVPIIGKSGGMDIEDGGIGDQGV